MSSSSLADYLASKYLTADAPKKPKKRKRHAASSGLIIADDDALGWDATSRDASTAREDDDAPVTIETKTFRRSTKSAWKAVGGDDRGPSSSSSASATPGAAAVDADTAAADAIIAANTDNAREDPEDAPAVVDDGNGGNEVVRMESGAHAGLQSAAQVAAQLEAARQAERARFAASDPAEAGRGQETIFRDASGRIVNVAMARAEARRAQAAEAEAARKKVEAQKGDVQKLESRARQEQLRDAKYMTLARYKDDAELNDELRGKELWNDPAAAFLSKKKGGLSRTGKPMYKGGGWEPNRYGIPPGYRWDGVDRGNGFERKWFRAQNQKGHRKEMEYAWQMDAD